MSFIRGFAPVAGRDARILILGSMPGEASLAANQYYAHPHNAFWPIMIRLLQLRPEASYEDRVAALQSSSIALWDVLESCRRSGSLDSRIENDTQTVNDFASFFSSQREIACIFFNGGKAEACFKRYVLPLQGMAAIKLLRLPSTSPANARLTFDDKCTIWHEAIRAALP